MNPTFKALQSHEHHPILERDIDATDDYRHLRFVRGYYLTDRQPVPLGDHWAEVQIGSYILGWDRRTSVGMASENGRTIYLIGRVFHLTLDSTSSADIAYHLLNARRASWEAYNRALYDLAGRYVVIDHGPEGTYLQTDAVGMRSAYYAKDGGTVTSHAGLTASIIGDDTPSAFGTKNWFRLTKAPAHPGRSTEYENVRMVTPNTELNVSQATVQRVGPTPRQHTLTAEQAAIELVPLLQRQMRALVAEGRPLVSLTAGLDSRTTLALSAPMRHDMTYFSYATYRGDAPSPSEPDMLLAQRICADHGLDFKKVVVTDILASGPLNDVIRANSRRIHSPSIAKAYLEQLPSDSVHIRSNVYEIGRSFFRLASSKEVVPLNALEFTKRIIRVKSHESFDAGIEAFEDWIAATGFSEVEGYDPYDLYYWELRMGRWLPAHMTESDIAHDTYTVVNSRRILELFLSVSLEDRLTAKVFDAIIGLTWPELFNYPVNGEMRRPSW